MAVVRCASASLRTVGPALSEALLGAARGLACAAQAPLGRLEGGSERDDRAWVDLIQAELSSRPQWVFLGMPGVGKGTYASRMARVLGVPHISAGDLVREELRRGSFVGQRMESVVKRGELLPDDLIVSLLRQRLAWGASVGERGFILDGFPRTEAQAEMLEEFSDVSLALNLKLREDVLVGKCLGRRTCSQCGEGFNLAHINLEGENGEPSIQMPALPPPDACLEKMLMRADDKEEVVRARLDVYRRESKPVEDFYRDRGVLVEFEITGGIPETWPRLLETVHHAEQSREEEQPKAA